MCWQRGLSAPGLLQPFGNPPFTGTGDKPVNSALTTEIRAVCVLIASVGMEGTGQGTGRGPELGLLGRLQFGAGGLGLAARCCSGSNSTLTPAAQLKYAAWGGFCPRLFADTFSS